MPCCGICRCHVVVCAGFFPIIFLFFVFFACYLFVFVTIIGNEHLLHDKRCPPSWLAIVVCVSIHFTKGKCVKRKLKQKESERERERRRRGQKWKLNCISHNNSLVCLLLAYACHTNCPTSTSAGIATGTYLSLFACHYNMTFDILYLIILYYTRPLCPVTYYTTYS